MTTLLCIKALASVVAAGAAVERLPQTARVVQINNAAIIA